MNRLNKLGSLNVLGKPAGSSSWAPSQLDGLIGWYKGIGYDTYIPDDITINDLTYLQWYRQTDVITRAIYKNKVLAFQSERILLSEDNGATYQYQNSWAGYGRIEVAKIFDNGNLMWATSEDIFYSDDNLATIKKSTILDANGAVYTFADHLANNFRELIESDIVIKNGVQIHAWSNYGNLPDGSCPTHIFYTIDNGVTIKICYTFTGDLLVRHSHVINYNAHEDCWVCQTGDGLFAADDCRWMKGVYDQSLDTWTWTQIAHGLESSYYKTAGMYFKFPYFYFGSDNTGDITKNMVLKGNLPNMDTGFVIVYDVNDFCTSLKGYYDDDLILTAEAITNTLVFSKDLGVNWITQDVTDLAFPAGNSFINFSEKRNDGWIKAHYDSAAISFRFNNPLWIKIK